ncbi:hypothetical protein IRZ48_12880 [Pseudomonas fulva]|uniref:hypothetical protein n=1 Tax=Pseudomonas fulva TaxID=47880 RepID=UPI0018AB2561|nr:hypothetical protein [Pseudomonas fulva]MBF8637506.1 hypothetical protein [Pseudomonas fulva]MBF8689499.1 hypothetical protein [Pseudomonas fulva]
MHDDDIKMIIESLHHAQETSERLIILQKIADRKINILISRLDRFLELNPRHIDFRIESIIEHPIKRNIQLTTIDLKNVEINSHFFSSVLFSIVSNETKEIKGIFVKIEDDFSPFGFKQMDENSLGFQLSLPSGKLGEDQAVELSSLGTTDWNIAKSMFDLLDKLFSDNNLAQCITRKRKSTLVDYVRNQAARFSAWPATLRFDNVSTGKIKHSENYHSLELRISNLNINHKTYSDFEFKLSTVTNESGDFSLHPRLEFPDACKNIIENWYAESVDGDKERLELRLAAPNALDTHVWGLLSDADRLLITGLIGKLPIIVGRLARDEPNVSMRWADWYSLAKNTRTIFVNNMIAQRSSQTTRKQILPA